MTTCINYCVEKSFDCFLDFFDLFTIFGLFCVFNCQLIICFEHFLDDFCKYFGVFCRFLVIFLSNFVCL